MSTSLNSRRRGTVLEDLSTASPSRMERSVGAARRPPDASTHAIAEDPESFFAGISRLFDKALRAARVEERAYDVAGKAVRVLFAGAATAGPLGQALRHLRQPSRAPADLTIGVWDSESTGVDMPPPPWPGDTPLIRCEWPPFNTDRFGTTLDPTSGMLSMLDKESGRGLVWIRDAEQIPYYEVAEPFRKLFAMWAPLHDLQMTHAAAVGTEEGGILLVGKGGSGKSTTAIRCLDAGFEYVGDDYLILSDRSVLTAHSLYASGKLFRSDAGSISSLQGDAGIATGAIKPSNEKAVFFFENRGRLVRMLPIRAIVRLIVTDRAMPVLRATSAGDALAAAAPSTIFVSPGAGSSDFARLARIVRRVPCYRLELGSDAEDVPAMLRDLIRQTKEAR